MRAYHGDPAIKEKYLARVQAHQAADELVQGYGYWKDGKGCAVGCTIHSGKHHYYEWELGIPWEVARMEDRTFECLPTAVAQKWPTRFLTAVPVGADLSDTIAQLMVWLLSDDGFGVVHYANAAGKAAIAAVRDLYRQRLAGDEPAQEEWQTAADAAFAAGYGATTSAYAAYSARYAALAGHDAYDASYAAHYAADAVSFTGNDDDDDAIDAATYAAWERIADRFIALLETAPVPAAV